MIYAILAVIGFGIYEIYKLSKLNKKREMIVWVSFAVITIAFIVYYFTNTNETSLVRIIMDNFKIDY